MAGSTAEFCLDPAGGGILAGAAAGAFFLAVFHHFSERLAEFPESGLEGVVTAFGDQIRAGGDEPGVEPERVFVFVETFDAHLRLLDADQLAERLERLANGRLAGSEAETTGIRDVQVHDVGWLEGSIRPPGSRRPRISSYPPIFDHDFFSALFFHKLEDWWE